MDLLSSDNLKILKSCNKESFMSDKIWSSLLQFAYNSIFDKDSTDPVTKFSKLNSTNIKAIHAATIALILESAKTDIQNDQLSMVLDDCGFGSTAKDEFISKFNLYRSDLRVHLGNIGFCSPHIVDLNWRLDYNIKKNQLHKVNELRYTISLTMANDKKIEFICSREELQDFSGKLKEAAKALERASHV